jgi:hypothetical protein
MTAASSRGSRSLASIACPAAGRCSADLDRLAGWRNRRARMCGGGPGSRSRVGQQSRGRGSRWRAYPVRAGGLGVADLAWEGSGALWSPLVAWTGCPACCRKLMSSAMLGSRLASLSRPAEVLTTHNRPQEGHKTAHKNPRASTWARTTDTRAPNSLPPGRRFGSRPSEVGTRGERPRSTWDRFGGFLS